MCTLISRSSYYTIYSIIEFYSIYKEYKSFYIYENIKIASCISYVFKSNTVVI